MNIGQILLLGIEIVLIVILILKFILSVKEHKEKIINGFYLGIGFFLSGLFISAIIGIIYILIINNLK